MKFKKLVSMALGFALLCAVIFTPVQMTLASTAGQLGLKTLRQSIPGMTQAPRAYSGTTSMPVSVDLSSSLPLPGDQGQQGSCVGWAVGYAAKTYQEGLDWKWNVRTNDHIFSPAYIYNQIHVDSSPSGGGAYFSDAFNLLVNQGCTTLADMPYNPNSYGYTTAPTSQQRANAAKFKAEKWSSLPYGDYNEVRAQLNSGNVVVIGIPVYPDFDNISSTNQIFDNTQGTHRGYHALCVVGYDDNKRALKIINSWGTGWGLSGYGWIGYDLYKAQYIEGYIMTDIINGPVTSNSKSPSFTCLGDGSKYLAAIDLNPAYGKKKAVFDFTFNSSPTGYLVNIGDSSTNNAGGGDSGTQTHDSELEIVNGVLNIYKSDAGGGGLLVSEPNAAPANGRISIEISNNTVTYYNYSTGVRKTWTSPYIFALNGQSDSEGPVNYKIYAGINRVVQGTWRSGSGVAKTYVSLVDPYKSNLGSPFSTSTVTDNHMYLSTSDLYPSGQTTKYTRITYDFTFGSFPRGYLVNIGDSSSNNGGGGDSGTQTHDSEIELTDGVLKIFKSDAGGGGLLISEPNAAPANGKIRIVISNNTVSYYNFTTGVSKTWTSPYIFALNGQSDSEGPVNYKVFAGINRVVSGTWRSGYGVIESKVTIN